MCGLGVEKTDEELAAQDCRNAQAYRLTIHNARANARRDYVLAGLLAVCSMTHGDVSSCCRFLVYMHVTHEVESREHIQMLFDKDRERPSPVATLLAAEGKD